MFHEHVFNESVGENVYNILSGFPRCNIYSILLVDVVKCFVVWNGMKLNVSSAMWAAEMRNIASSKSWAE